MNLQPSTLSPLPKTYRGAPTDPNWCGTMRDEYTTIETNHTWDLIHHLVGVNIVLVSGFIITNFIWMVLLIATNLVGSFVVLLAAKC
jgi:hypothetical protein